MTTHTIRLHNIAQVKDFVNQCSGCSFEITLSSGQAVINAKSIMGLFGLDLNAPIVMRTEGEGEELAAFLKEVGKYIVETQD
ncbi:MAG TPA: HPr family phosphocarrier protein [Candidatus Galloscillospira excrementipullorum]|nr:HPr family phosphocarrier protein [Candidatus Galloscillospira excrementipullorum]